jgi:hypothetical protein
MSFIPRLGWNFAREKQAKEVLRANVDVKILSVSETKDAIADRLVLMKYFSFDPKSWVISNSMNGWSKYDKMPVRNQLSNDCTNHGFNSAVQWWQTIHAYLGLKEQECFLGHRPFAYGCYGAYSNEYGDVGRTISSMLNGAAAIGILPEDTDGAPDYSMSLIREWVKRYSSIESAPYGEFVKVANRYKITVGELDNTTQMHWDACFAGYTVCHGSYNLHQLQSNGWWKSQGLGGHCRASAGWGIEDGTEYIGMENSWNDGWGRLSKAELTKLVNARYYEAFAIIDMQPMEATKNNYDIIPGE